MVKKIIPLRIALLRKLTNKKYKCFDCKKSFYKYQMFICPSCNKPTFCTICLEGICFYSCEITVKKL